MLQTGTLRKPYFLFCLWSFHFPLQEQRAYMRSQCVIAKKTRRQQGEPSAFS